MADDQDQKDSNTDISRRDFVTLSVAAGVALATGNTSEAAVPVVEENVTIKTQDGTCDAAFIHPDVGAHPAVLIWPDAFGLRPAMREIGTFRKNCRCLVSLQSETAHAFRHARATRFLSRAHGVHGLRLV